MQTLSIVIPAKDEEKYLPRLLDSIKKQSLQPREVVIADAHSSDRTREIAERFGARVIDGGLPGAGRNRGAEAATGDWLLFLDADVELQDHALLEQALCEIEERGLDIATADVFPLEGNQYDRVTHRIYNRYVRLCARKHLHAPGFFIFVRRDLHKKITGFDESVVFCEDHEYVNRASHYGRFGFLESVHVHVSTRRQRRDGRLSMAVKYILAELHLLTLGPIRHQKFNYTFGYEGKECPLRRTER